MSTWYVQDGNERRTLTERALRSELRDNELKGTELARPEHQTAWKPLHEYPLFTEEVPHSGSPAMAAWKRTVISYGVHLAIFIVVMSVLGFPTWLLLLWGFFVLMHTFRAAPSMQNLLRQYRGVPAVVEGERPLAREEDRFLHDVEKALEEVNLAFHEDPERSKEDEPDLVRIHEVADRLHHQRQTLLAAVDEAARLQLQEELEASRAAADDAPDQRTAEVFEAEARAVAERLAAMEAAATAARRIEARQKTLLHQLQGLRIALLRSTAEEILTATNLAGRIDKIRGELQADSEVEEELARARRGTQKIGS